MIQPADAVDALFSDACPCAPCTARHLAALLPCACVLLSRPARASCCPARASCCQSLSPATPQPAGPCSYAIRGAALSTIGNFSTRTVAEDVALGPALKSSSLHGVYLKQYLTYGEAAKDTRQVRVADDDPAAAACCQVCQCRGAARSP